MHQREILSTEIVKKSKNKSKQLDFDPLPKKIIETIKSREKHMCFKKKGTDSTPQCNKSSIPGAVTQRSCVYGGARVVLMPITDAVHLVHGPIGCASCTWDIRGSLSSTSQLYKTGFSTNMEEKDIVFGGEKKLLDTLIEINRLYQPPAIFVYATCVVGLIGDDLKAVCKEAEKITSTRIIPVQSEGFRSFNKSLGHQLAGDALLDYVIGTSHPPSSSNPFTLNIVGEFNIAGDLWGIKPLLEKLGIEIISTLTGDSLVEDIARAHQANLNIVQCQKSSNYIAREMEKRYGIPYLKVNFFGISDTAYSLLSIAHFFQYPQMISRAEKLIENERKRVEDSIKIFQKRLEGKRVAVYVGGNKAWSLIKAFEELGMEVIMTGTQNGLPKDYKKIKETVQEGTLIVDDANAMELSSLLKKYNPDLVISGAKEKYLSMKMGIPFCEFNHDRITSFSGFDGYINFAQDLDRAVSSPVWDHIKKPLKAA
ncbi:MAG: nitrogenase iron-molybdenum cofactor biosynthesis protein NifE [Methanobacteriaceae archaeon]|nr:nitrogenase iron-molybdenum cofactor biosynthesis protein NifE [Methanobacteriaceae archaeon]